MKNVGLLILRLTVGGLLAGHGAQKLFGAFQGPGIQGTTGWMESMGLRPGKPWAFLAGLSEFGGGLLTLLGFLNPIGPLGAIGAMGMAATKVHWGKPVWVTSGGAELPLTNIAAATALALAGPGDISLDKALGIRLPRRVVFLPGLVLVAISVGAGLFLSNRNQAQQQPQSRVEEQAQPQAQEENRPEAVRVADKPAAKELEQRDEHAAGDMDRVAGAELQAGDDASHPV